jgi:preprotein translocase subunit YajC
MEQLTQFATVLLMFVVIYFFMIRPQQKKELKTKIWNIKSMIKSLLKVVFMVKVAELAETTIVSKQWQEN